jgi:hypothetical protein
MTNNATSEVTAIGIRLIDDAYMAWFNAESECERALRAWFQRTDAEQGDAYLAYRVALDHEEAAARRLGRVWQFAEICHAGFVQGIESVVQ